MKRFIIRMLAVLMMTAFVLTAFPARAGERTADGTTEAEDSADSAADPGEGDFSEIALPEGFGEYTETVTDLSLPEAEELLDAYVAQQFSAQKNSRRGLALSEAERDMYGRVMEKVSEVAAGTLNNTDFPYFYVDLSKLEDITVTAEELGMDTLVDWNGSGYVYKQAAITALLQLMHSQINMTKVVDSLLRNLPYELYWFDKTRGYGYRHSLNGNVNYTINNGNIDSISLKEPYVYLYMYVSKDYSTSEKPGTFEVNTTLTQAAAKVAENAQKVVNAAAGKTDLERLRYYKEWICQEVSYNDAAAGGGAAYGDPWQLIYVFDDNSKTNVVCEGYAKAFKLLCDLTKFNSDLIECRLMDGPITDGESSGSHMWNVIRMDDGQNYLVDVTNCDTGMIGEPEDLFLVGSASGDASGYVITIGYQWISYTYSQKEEYGYFYTPEERTLSKCSYGAHTWDQGTEIAAATCTAEGEMVYTCTICQCQRAETTPLNPNHHALHYHAEVPATCAVAGCAAHYQCGRCQLIFLDAAGQVTVTQEGLTLPLSDQHTIVTRKEEGFVRQVCEICQHLFDERPIRNGLVEENGQFRLYDDDEFCHSFHGLWANPVDSHKLYLIEAGIWNDSYTGLWQNTEGEVYYIADGIMTSGWQLVSEKWYYFAPSGEMATGWQQIHGGWYYMNAEGVMQTGWQYIDERWYYFAPTGGMKTGWQNVYGGWYYLAAEGAMQTGWLYKDGYWYYLADSGAMQIGWKKIGDKTYYFHSSGAMASLEYINGWWLNSDGSWTYPYQATWRWGSKGWWYGDESGWYAKSGTYKIDGTYYTFDGSGWLE